MIVGPEKSKGTRKYYSRLIPPKTFHMFTEQFRYFFGLMWNDRNQLKVNIAGMIRFRSGWTIKILANRAWSYQQKYPDKFSKF